MNAWDYAHYVFDLIQHYLSNGAEAYVYWNMVLEEGGVSTWGWRQNSLMCVAPDGSDFTRNPEYYVMRHASGFVKPRASVLRLKGAWAGNTLAFENRDGSLVYVLQNSFDVARVVTLRHGEQSFDVELPAMSVNTLVI